MVLRRRHRADRQHAPARVLRHALVELDALSFAAVRGPLSRKARTSAAATDPAPPRSNRAPSPLASTCARAAPTDTLKFSDSARPRIGSRTRTSARLPQLPPRCPPPRSRRPRHASRSSSRPRQNPPLPETSPWPPRCDLRTSIEPPTLAHHHAPRGRQPLLRATARPSPTSCASCGPASVAWDRRGRLVPRLVLRPPRANPRRYGHLDTRRRRVVLRQAQALEGCSGARRPRTGASSVVGRPAGTCPFVLLTRKVLVCEQL